MKKLIISRKKTFAGSLLPYWIIVGFRKAVFMQKYKFDEDLCEMNTEGRPLSGITMEELDKIGIHSVDKISLDMHRLPIYYIDNRYIDNLYNKRR